MTGTLYCPVCGAANKPGSRFCLKDGTPIPALDPGRYSSGFVRAPGTYAPEEIQAVMLRVAAAVVRIRVRTTTTYKYPVAYWKDDEAEHFGRAMIGRIETSDTEARISGSGFATGDGGEIVTNAHVARPDGMEADLTLETQDGRSFPARLKGVDAASDLALLQVEGASLPALDWADSGSLRVGQEAWAIGNPLDIGISITRGTISGISGTRMGMNQIESFIHSDAHITHGNSGGPVVDIYGHVVGVTDIGFSQAKGQGYAIPSRMVQLVVDRLHRDGRYERGFVGLQVLSIDQDATRRYGLKRTAGVVVTYILPGTPAQRAGLKVGDVIVGVNGRLATGMYTLQEAISSIGPGMPLTLNIDRQGGSLDVPITTARRPEAPRVDPLEEMQNYLRIRFEEDPAIRQVLIRDPSRSRHAPGLFDGHRIKSVLPAQDWPEEPITLNYYKTRSKRVEVDTLADLRAALARAYVGGRMAATFEIDYPTSPIASVAFDEIWPVIL